MISAGLRFKVLLAPSFKGAHKRSERKPWPRFWRSLVLAWKDWKLRVPPRFRWWRQAWYSLEVASSGRSLFLFPRGMIFFRDSAALFPAIHLYNASEDLPRLAWGVLRRVGDLAGWLGGHAKRLIWSGSVTPRQCGENQIRSRSSFP